MQPSGTATLPEPAGAVAVAIPVLGRPQRVQGLLSALSASQGALELAPLFVCSPGDEEQIEAVRAAARADERVSLIITDFAAGAGDFARKTNLCFRFTNEPWFFAGADDLHFHPGWAEEAVRVAEEFGAGMVGTNDRGNAKVMAGLHATHSLFRRSYIEECGTVDRPGHVYCEEYDHQWVDTEAYETAVARDCFAYAADAIVEHNHPFWGKGEMDATYEKGMARAAHDRQLFARRRALWQ